MTARLSSGGKRRSEREWRSLLARFAGSGLSVEAFCDAEATSTASFYRWRALLGHAITVANSADTTRPAFVDLGVLDSTGRPSGRLELKLDLGSGMILHLVRD